MARRSKPTPARLSIGLIPTVAPYLLPIALPIPGSENIRLELGVREARTHTLLKELRESRLGAIIVALPAEAEGVFCMPILKDRFLRAGTKALPESGVHPPQIEPFRTIGPARRTLTLTEEAPWIGVPADAFQRAGQVAFGSGSGYKGAPQQEV